MIVAIFIFAVLLSAVVRDLGGVVVPAIFLASVLGLCVIAMLDMKPRQ